jgi:hypothetical protein
MTDFIHHCALTLSLGVSPVVFLLSLLYKRQYRGIIMKWKKAQLAIFTILTFITNFTLFVLACFFFASYLGRIDGIHLFAGFSTKAMLYLGGDCVLLMLAVTLSYLAIQNLLIQYITQDGIVLLPLGIGTHSLEEKTLQWGQIKDYYLHSDYPVTHFTFLVQKHDFKLERHTLKVPFYALPRFEALLETCLLQQQQLRERSRSVLRNISNN